MSALSAWPRPSRIPVADTEDLTVLERVQGAAGGAWCEAMPVGADRTVLTAGSLRGPVGERQTAQLQLRSAIRAYARLDLPPGEALAQLDGLLTELPDPFRASLLYLVADPVEEVLTYATARHPVPVLRGPDGAVTEVPTPSGGVLGETTGPFAEEVVGWPSGASAALWAAGDGHDPASGWSRRVAAVVAGTAVAGVEEFADVVEQEVAPAGAALLVVSRPPAVGLGVGQVRVIELELAEGEDPTRRARAFCYGVLSTWDLPPLIREDIVLAVSELVANALLHVGAAEALRLRRTPSRVVVEVFDAERAMPRPRLADVDAESGWGLHLVRRVASRWGARAVPGGKAVWCEFEIPAPAQAVC